jgi:hypothetical protein
MLTPLRALVRPHPSARRPGLAPYLNVGCAELVDTLAAVRPKEMKSAISGCGQAMIVPASLPAATSLTVRGHVRAVFDRRNLEVREKRGAAVE